MWILAAAGVSRDTTDDRSMLPPTNHLPPKRSAAKPPGTCKHRHIANRLIAAAYGQSHGATGEFLYHFLTFAYVPAPSACDFQHFCLQNFW